MRLLTLPALLALGPALVACGPGDEACDPTEPGTICTISGVGKSGYQGDAPIDALDAEMSLPQDTLTADDGTIYIADWNNHRIRRLNGDGVLEWVAGQGEIGGSLEDEVTNQDFNHLTQLMWDCETGQDMVVAAWHNSKIRTLDLDTGAIVDTCGDGRRAYSGDGGVAHEAALDLPAAMACDPAGDLVIMDQANQVIRKVDAAGVITRIAGQCIIDAAAPAGPGACAEPVQCPGSNKLTCGDPAATCGSPCTPSFNGDMVPALDARLAQPFGQSADPAGRMVYDADGNLLFADSSNHLIRRIRAADGLIEIVAGTPPVDGVAQKGYAGDGGPATGALLNNPVDLALGDDGTLYFTDVYNHCVRAVATDGTISTVAGQCGEFGFEGDGSDPQEALLNLPFGVEYWNGRLHIADSGNHRIRSIILE